METIIKKITHTEEDKKIYEQAGQILRAGGLVAFPTETVYGLGADALDAKASAKIYAAKGRPSDNPLIVHIADVNALYDLAKEVPDKALVLAEKFWPGPLTMILKKKDKVPDSITGGLGTVAIRMPSHPVAAELIRSSGVYIAAPSANTSGKPSPTRAEHVINDLSGRIDMIIQDDTVDIGVESTIIDLSEEVPTILRPGYITQAMFEEAIGKTIIDPAIMGSLKEGVIPKAPGMKYKHYAPKADVTIIDSSLEAFRDYVKAHGDKDTTLMVFTDSDCEGLDMPHICYGANDEEQAKELFDVLRDLDDIGAKKVYARCPNKDGVGLAVYNRLLRAAGFQVVTL